MSLDAHRAKAPSLARLMDVGEDDNWGVDELARMLAHQLDAPLRFDMTLASGELGRRLDGYCAKGKPLPNRFGDLLHGPNPSVELLELTKQFAKANRSHADGMVRQVAHVLYYASCVAARLRCGRSITQLSDAELRSGVTWALQQPWVDAKTRMLFDEGAALLDAPR